MATSDTDSRWGKIGRCIAIPVGVALLVAASGLLVGCGIGSDHDSSREVDSTERTDAEGVDAEGSDCRATSSPETCRLRPACRWLELTCDTGRVAAGCVGAERSGPIPFECDAAGSDGASDASATDAGLDCGQYGSSAACRARPECRWWSRQCGGEVVEACVRRDEVPGEGMCPRGGDTRPSSDTSDASVRDGRASDAATTDVGVWRDGGSCETVEDSDRCRQLDRCRWWSPDCEAEETDGACLAEGDTPPKTKCDEDDRDDCHEIDGETACSDANCGWVAEGCGGGYDETIQVDACLPSGTCDSDADCPSDHRCEELWVDPCHDSQCTACGERETKCMPTTMLE